MDCLIKIVIQSKWVCKWCNKEVTSLVAQIVKNLPAMRETWVQSLDLEDPLEKGIATHSNILSEESHGQRGLAGYGS